MSNKNQAPGGDSDPLPNNFNANFTSSMRKSNAGKISGAESGGNATGPRLTEDRGKDGTA